VEGALTDYARRHAEERKPILNLESTMDELLAKLTALDFKYAKQPETLVSDTQYPILIRLNKHDSALSEIDYGNVRQVSPVCPCAALVILALALAAVIGFWP
jgi:hypothetical protein